MIYLHVGKPKTGTSTIQRALIANQANLLEKEYLYPQAGILHWGHHNIYYDLAKDSINYKPSLGSFQLLLENLIKFKLNNPAGNIILSSETFSGAYEGILERLIIPLQQIDTVIPIIYLREQLSYFFSFWSMWAHQKKTQYKFEKWAAYHIETDLYGGNYLKDIKKIEKVTGSSDIKIVIYEEVDRNNFFNHFLSLCNIKNTQGLTQPVAEFNKSQLSTLNHLKGSNLIRDLCKERYSEGNQLIARKYFSREHLFPQKVDNSADGPLKSDRHYA